MPSKRTVKMVFPSDEDAKHFMSWMYHYGHLEFQSWLEDSNSPMMDLKTEWDEYKIMVEEKDNDPDLIDFKNT